MNSISIYVACHPHDYEVHDDGTGNPPKPGTRNTYTFSCASHCFCIPLSLALFLKNVTACDTGVREDH